MMRLVFRGRIREWHRIVAVVAAMAAASAQTADASIPRPNPTDLSRLVEWVLATGVQSEIRGAASAAVGLGGRTVSVQSRAFREEGSHFTDAVAVARSDDGPIIFFSRTDQNSGVTAMWV